MRQATEDLRSGRSVDRLPGRASRGSRPDADRSMRGAGGQQNLFDRIRAEVDVRLRGRGGSGDAGSSVAQDVARNVTDAAERRVGGGAALRGVSQVGRLVSRAGPAGGVAIAAAGAALAIAGLGAAAVAASSAFARVGDSIEDLSGPVAAVRARLEVERELARVERARLLGDRVAQVDAARGRLALAIEDLKTSVADSLADLAPVIEAILDGITTGVRGLQAIKEGIDVLLSPLDEEERKQFREAIDRFTEAAASIFDNDEIKAQPIDGDIAALLGLPTGDDEGKPEANPGLVP